MPLIVRVRGFEVNGVPKNIGDELTFAEESAVRQNPSLLARCTNTAKTVHPPEKPSFGQTSSE